MQWFKGFKSRIVLKAPLTGSVIDITEVDDPIFADKMVGDGVAILPTDGVVVAPCDGKLVQVFSTKHALCIEADAGFDLLIHVGLDTVELKGDGFNLLVEENTRVKAGQILMKIDLERIEQLGKKTVSPFLITTMQDVEIVSRHFRKVTAGETPIMKVKVLNKN